MPGPSISAIVPVYNSQSTLFELTDRLTGVLQSLTDQFEIILVNDGSPDNSWQVIDTLCEQHGWIRGINLMRNYGQHNALLAGIRQANHEIIVTLDDDLQNPPEEIHKLIARLDPQTDVVYGKPDREQHGLLRNLASRMTKLALQSSMGVETARNVSAFRAFRRIVSEAFLDYRGPYVSIDVLLTWGSTRFRHITVQHEERMQGESQYTVRKLITHALNMLTGFSTLPLQAASLLGFSLTFFGFLVLLWVIGRLLIEGGSVPGFPFLASIIAIFSGAQLFALGIIGEYLARMHFRLMDRPAYVIRQSKQNVGQKVPRFPHAQSRALEDG